MTEHVSCSVSFCSCYLKRWKRPPTALLGVRLTPLSALFYFNIGVYTHKTDIQTKHQVIHVTCGIWIEIHVAMQALYQRYLHTLATSYNLDYSSNI